MKSAYPTSSDTISLTKTRKDSIMAKSQNVPKAQKRAEEKRNRKVANSSPAAVKQFKPVNRQKRKHGELTKDTGLLNELSTRSHHTAAKRRSDEIKAAKMSANTAKVSANTAALMQVAATVRPKSSTTPEVERHETVTNRSHKQIDTIVDRDGFRTKQLLGIAKAHSAVADLTPESPAQVAALKVIENYTRLPWLGVNKTFDAAVKAAMNPNSNNPVPPEHRSNLKAMTMGKYRAKRAIAAAWRQHQSTEVSASA